jgi:hypothetical protein
MESLEDQSTHNDENSVTFTLKSEQCFLECEAVFYCIFLPDVSEESGTFCWYNYTVQDRISGLNKVGNPSIWVEESISIELAHFLL